MFDKRRRLALIAVAMLALACTSTPTATPVATPDASSAPAIEGSPAAERCIETVVIRGGKFQPDNLTVPRNCVVLFTNRDDTTEQIQGNDFLLGEMGKDQSWAHTYKEPGTFTFRSTKTQTLQGTITVR